MMCLMRNAMISCDQTEGLTILEHGESVSRFYKDLISHIRTGDVLKNEWRLPDWIYDPVITDNLFSDEIMDEYQVFHDCGKPKCIVWDKDGKRHFPDHARVSEVTWLAAGGDP